MGPKNVRQLAGPGVSGLENDTPLWHYDVEAADVPTLISDPAKFFAGTSIAEAFAAHKQTHEVTFVGGASKWCCYTSGSESICHNHAA